MGTRADFYIKTIDEEPIEHNKPIEWVASIAWDGYPSGIEPQVFKAYSISQYENALKDFFKTRNDVTYPNEGWPWPWNTSAITDFVYLYDQKKGKVLVFYKDNQWFDVSRYKDEDFYPEDVDDLIIEATYGLPVFNTDSPAFGNRSGLIIIGS